MLQSKLRPEVPEVTAVFARAQLRSGHAEAARYSASIGPAAAARNDPVASGGSAAAGDIRKGGMSLRRRVRPAPLLAALGLGASLLGCLMPSKGTPVFVDHRAGSFWSGKALLLEVSEDRLQCKVAIRDRALFVHERWVRCASVHPRSPSAS
jgi:hypothetical protein